MSSIFDELAKLISVISADTNIGLLCGDVNCARTDTDNIDNNLWIDSTHQREGTIF